MAAAAIANGAAIAIFAGNASAGATPRPMFSVDSWAPGDTQDAEILVRSADVSGRPYLEVRNLGETCPVDCSPASPALSGLLIMTATAPDGSRWRGTLDELESAAVLTGGTVAANADPRPYRVSLTLPQRTGNDGEGLSASYEMQWGVMDASGKPLTRVLGLATRRGRGGGTSSTQILGSDLPFTGFSTLMTVVASLALIGCGTVLLLAGRRGRPGRTSAARPTQD